MNQMPKIQQCFDPKLLNAPPEERSKFFEEKVLQHPHLHRASENLWEEVRYAPKSSITLLTGPVASGRTTLARAFWQKFKLEQRQAMDEDRSFIPIVGAAAPAPNPQTNQVAWQTLLNDILGQLGSDLVGGRVYVPPEQFALTGIPLVSRKVSIPAQIQSIARLLEERKTKIVLINQADNLFDMHNPRSVRSAVQSLCQIVQGSDAKLVLCGGYSLASVGEYSGEWLSRSNPIHLRRYDISREEERNAFASSVYGLLSSFPAKLAFQTLTEADVEKFHTSSIGCVGHLKAMLKKALGRAVHHPQIPVTLDFLRQFALDNKSLKHLASEARMGEEKLIDIDQDEVRKALGQVDDVISRAKKPARGNGIHQLRIGERSPVRDAVGSRP